MNYTTENGKVENEGENLPFISKTEVVIVEGLEGKGAKSLEKFVEEKIPVKETISGEKKSGLCGSYTGIILALISGLIFTIGTILAKYLKHYHPFTLAVYRLQGILFPSILMVLCARKKKVFKEIWPLNESERRNCFTGIVIRASLGCSALYLHFYALKYLQVADVAVVSSTKPICVTIAAFLLLGESCGVVPVLTAVLAMIGVGVITKPPILTGGEEFKKETLIGVGFALGSILTDTIVVVIIRKLKKIHVSVMMLSLGIWGSVQSVIFASSIGELKLPQNGTDWALAGGMATVALLNQAGMNLALQYEQASPVAVTRTMDFIWAFLLQFFVMGVSPDWCSLVGALVIIFCVFITAFRKWLVGLPKEHNTRKRFWIVLL